MLKKKRPGRRSKIRIHQKNELDQLCRMVVFGLAGNKCQRCQSTRAIQWAHVFSRRYLATRWHLHNSMCLCARCHFWWHDRPLEAAEWWISTFGREADQELRRRLKSKHKPNLDKIASELNTKLEELNERPA